MKSELLRIAVLVAATAVLVGCTPGPKKAGPVVPDQARAALKTTLDAWKDGKAIDSLKSAEPSIVAQDMDWLAGKKLTSYEVLGDGVAQDANLRIDVNLTLEGSATPKKVAYIVGTYPLLTVFRAPFE
jgi:hypothetical protein